MLSPRKWWQPRASRIPLLFAVTFATLSVLWLVAIHAPVAPSHYMVAGDLLYIGGTASLVFAVIRFSRSALRQSAVAVRDSHERLRAAIAAAPLAIITLDAAGKVISLNPAAERMFGWSAAEVLGRVHPLVAPALGERFRMFLAGVLKGRSLTDVQARLQRKDGTQVDVSFAAAPMFSHTGHANGVVVVVADVTETQRAGEMLWRYQLLVEHTRDIVLFAGGDGRILEANRAACLAYGYSREELLALSLADLQTGWATGERPAGREPVSFEAVHRRRDGRTFSVEVSTFAAEINGEPVVLSLVRDITQRRRREATQALQHEVDHHILHQGGLAQVLQFMCERLVSLYDTALVWIGTKEPDGSIRIRARAGARTAYLDEIVVRWDDTPEGRGPGGTAIRTGQPQVSDVETDERFRPWLDRAREFGLRSFLAIPLLAGGEAFGALAVYSTHPRAFDQETVDALAALADEVADSLAEAGRQEQVRLQTAALESAANAVVITDRDGVVRWVNPAFTRLTGYTAAEVVGRTPRLLKSGQHSAGFYRELWETVLAGQTWHGEMYNLRKDGSLYTEEQTITPVRDAQGQITHFIAIKQDVTERRQQEDQIRYLALHDPLTNLPNRRAFQEHLERAWERARRGFGGALLILDLDNFKLVNDTLGHTVGDQLLVTLANLLAGLRRGQDLLARLGGDEFAVLLEDTRPDEARDVAERLRQGVAEFRFQLGGGSFDLGISVGVALIDGRLEPPSLLALADSALYAAKDLGKNRVVLYRSEEDKGAHLAEAGQWASRIKDALREQRFLLHFQPVVRLGSGQAGHFEALIRLRDRDGGIILPGAFMPAAERFGLVSQVDRWMVETVLDLLLARPELRLFINLSGASLGDESLLACIEERVRASGVAPGRLAIEVTETAAVTDLVQAQHWMRRLKALGCQFALDDFGIGFSSFSYLKALPADYVKIDGAFIRNLDTDPTNRAIVQAITTVAHTLGKEVIAEWVESEGVARKLRELGVEHGQGYYWGQPGPQYWDQPGAQLT